MYATNGVVKTNDPVLVYERISYRCIHQGQHTSKASVRVSRSLRRGCGAAFNIVKLDGKLVSTKANLVHNHPADDTKDSMYRRNMGFTDAEKPVVDNLLALGPKTESLKRLLRGN